MGRHPHAGTAARRIPIPIQGGTAVKLSTPLDLAAFRDGWSGIVATPTANRAVGDTTLTLNTPLENGCETGVHTTANRLDGLQFKHAGAIYRITDQTAGAIITFTPALTAAMTANQTILKIQSDLPRCASWLYLMATTAIDTYYSLDNNTTAAGGEYSTIPASMSKLLIDDDLGLACHPIFLVGSAAGTVELEVYT